MRRNLWKRQSRPKRIWTEILSQSTFALHVKLTGRKSLAAEGDNCFIKVVMEKEKPLSVILKGKRKEVTLHSFAEGKKGSILSILVGRNSGLILDGVKMQWGKNVAAAGRIIINKISEDVRITKAEDVEAGHSILLGRKLEE